MWSGLMIFQLDDTDSTGIVLTATVLVGNIALFCWFVLQLANEKLFERRQAKLEEAEIEIKNLNLLITDKRQQIHFRSKNFVFKGTRKNIPQELLDEIIVNKKI